MMYGYGGTPAGPGIRPRFAPARGTHPTGNRNTIMRFLRDLAAWPGVAR